MKSGYLGWVSLEMMSIHQVNKVYEQLGFYISCKNGKVLEFEKESE